MTKAVVTRKKVSYIYVLLDLHAPNTIRCVLNRRKKVSDKRNQYHHCYLRNLQLIRTQDLHHYAHLCSSQHNFFVALHADCDFQLLQHLCYQPSTAKKHDGINSYYEKGRNEHVWTSLFSYLRWIFWCHIEHTSKVKRVQLLFVACNSCKPDLFISKSILIASSCACHFFS